MNELIAKIEELAGEELKRANEEHPLFSSAHEAHAVIREEVDELKQDVKWLTDNVEGAWEFVKKDNEERTKTHIGQARKAATMAAAEAVQVAAMCMKYFASLEKREGHVADDELDEFFGEIRNGIRRMLREGAK